MDRAANRSWNVALIATAVRRERVARYGKVVMAGRRMARMRGGAWERRDHPILVRAAALAGTRQRASGPD